MVGETQSSPKGAQSLSWLGKIAVAIRLTRWREHFPFSVPLTLVGALLALEPDAGRADWRLAAVLMANLLAMSFAFMLNDIEDAPDDALDPEKRAHNVISSGLLGRREGLAMTWAVFVASLALYAAAGGLALPLGAATLALCALYSAYPFRFKARPLTDVISHALMLSGLLIATGFFTYGSEPGSVWLVIGAASLFSAYGQFYNQVADYEVDKQAGLRNTAVLLGERATALLGYLSIALALAFMAAAMLQGLFPDWLGIILVIGMVACSLFPWELDMRGNLAQDGGNLQRPALIVANLLAMCWLAANLNLLAVG